MLFRSALKVILVCKALPESKVTLARWVQMERMAPKVNQHQTFPMLQVQPVYKVKKERRAIKENQELQARMVYLEQTDPLALRATLEQRALKANKASADLLAKLVLRATQEPRAIPEQLVLKEPRAIRVIPEQLVLKVPRVSKVFKVLLASRATLEQLVPRAIRVIPEQLVLKASKEFKVFKD